MANRLGLTNKEVAALLAKHGPNELPEKKPPSGGAIFLAQITNPLVYILLIAGGVTLALGEYSDATIIGIAVFLNTVLGFIQERRANNALYALKQMIHPTAKVVRGGKEIAVDADSIVPGDVVILDQGAKIPADGKLLEANQFFVSEALLTGESAPLEKAEQDEVYMGTLVTAGRGVMAVYLTGEETQMGKIAITVQEEGEETPLKRQLARFSRELTLLVVGLTAFVFIIGLMTGRELEEVFTTSVALAVSAIPEGLLVALTVILAIGMQRILARRGLVRHLVSAETLGGVTTICMDKTGTLTAGEMQVTKVVGDTAATIEQAIIANDRDDPVVIAAWNWAVKQGGDEQHLVERHPRIDALPFSSQERFFACLNRGSGGENTLYVNGAPEYLLAWSTLTRKERKAIELSIEAHTKEGKRVLGMAKKTVQAAKEKLAKADVTDGLTWVGFLVFSDPVRESVRSALKEAQTAGIRLVVITGDYTQTAVSVMNQLGVQVRPEDTFLGSSLDNLSEAQLAARMRTTGTILFARTTPDQKLKIVRALQANGEVVAMTGDGVNDAPALRRSDIGVVVGEATDVAKETADLVLLDSNFATIVAAIEEGRGIYDNIRKVVLYLMSDAFEEIVAVTAALIIGLPLPVTAAQILWINLVSDGLPNLALTVDPKAKGSMLRPPRSPKQNVVSMWMRTIIATVSLAGGVVAFAVFYYFYTTTGDIALARSLAFATLGINSLVYVFSIRTLKNSFWEENPFENRWLNIAVIAGLALQFIPFAFVPLRNLLGLTTLAPLHVGVVFVSSLSMFILIEVTKDIVHKDS